MQLPRVESKSNTAPVDGNRVILDTKPHGLACDVVFDSGSLSAPKLGEGAGSDPGSSPTVSTDFLVSTGSTPESFFGACQATATVTPPAPDAATEHLMPASLALAHATYLSTVPGGSLTYSA